MRDFGNLGKPDKSTIVGGIMGKISPNAYCNTAKSSEYYALEEEESIWIIRKMSLAKNRGSV